MSKLASFRHHRRLLALIALLMLIILIPVAVYLARTPEESQARWWNDGWLYRKLVTVTYSGTENLTEYQVLIDGLDTATLVSSSKLQSDCDDLRFTNASGTQLSYFIVGATCNTTDTEIFVKTDRIPASDIMLYMYYGNPTASIGHDEVGTFSYTTEKTVAYLLGDEDAVATEDWSGAVSVLSLHNGNSITHNGTTVNLDFFVNDTTSITANDFEPISAKGLFSITDRDQSEIPTPVSWAGTEFTGQTTALALNDDFYIISPWAETDISLYINGIAQSTCGQTLPYTIAAGGSIELGCNLTDSATFRITTTDNVPVLVFNANTRDSNQDRFPRPLYPAQDSSGQPIYGFGDAYVTSNGTSTNYSYLLHTNASATTGTLSADSTLSIPGVGTNFSYTSGPYKLTSTTTGGSLAGFEYSDGNGTDGTTWVGRREFGTILGMGATTEYIAPVSDQSTTCTTYNDDGTTKDTQTLTSSNSEVYGLSSNAFGTGAAVTYEPNQWYMKCDKPVYAWWQYILDDQKHTVTWPMMRQFTYPTPTTSISGSEELTPHPISVWKLDEGAENTCTGGTNDACDSAAGKNDGTNTATRLTDTSCVSGKCLSFDGNDDVVTISNDNDIDFDLGINDGFSVSFWVKALSDGENNTGEIIEKGSHFYCRTDTEAGGFADLECSINLATTDPTVNITDGLTIGQWHHVEATYADDGDDDLLVYIDGLLRGTGAGDGAPVGTDASAILIGGDASNNFHGYIDEVKIFGYERTAAQVKTDYIEGASGAGSNIAVGIGGTTMPSPNLWWRFDEGSGTTANNAGSNGSTYNGAITSGTWTLSGKFDKALTFTASSSVADTITDPGSTNSLSLWVYPTTSAASKTLITSGKLTTDASSRPIYGTCTGTALSLNTWTHIAAVSNGAGSCAVYQNGAATSTNTTGVSFGTSFNVGGSSFTGSIDEVKFYNVALTADQVKVDMNNAGALSVASTGGEAATFSDGAATLVGFYPLDENTGIAAGSTADRSGGGFNGTLTAIDATDWIPGIKGSALNLDGAAEYVDVGAGPGTVRSVTFWVKPATTTEYFINLASTTDYIWNNAGTLTATGLSSPTFYVNGIPTTTFSTIGAWSHVAVVTASAESAGNLDIGRTQNANYLEGAIDEVKLFSTALTQAQVMFEYNRGGPIAWYRMDECQGTVINDLSGNSLTGTLTIGTSGTNTLPGNCLSNTSSHAWNNGKTGKINNAMSFDDTDDYVSVADNNALDLTSGLSISAWVKTAANEANNVIVSKGASYEMGVTNTGALYWDGAGAQVDDGKTLVGSGTWHHVVVTNNDTTATFYVDGVQTGTATAGVDVDNTTALYIGYDGANYFDGLIDEVRVFNYPLSASQVKNVMTNGSVRFE